MKRVLAMVAKVLAAIPVFVLAWSVDLGRFILKCMPGYRPTDPSELVEQYAEAVEQAQVTPAADQRLEHVRQIAGQLAAGQMPSEDLSDGLSPQAVQWLGVMSPEMLAMVAKAKPEELRQHMKGHRTIRGLLAYDRESVEAYAAAVAQEPEPEIERRRRRPRPERLAAGFARV
ncbi:hypothetical protein [Devosia submarina]|uniref:hypothetical protein n=1 Tax=Devosia submarina TaxID=1173082 RepID=UPI001300A0DD|nr:hypothetical protein [Devosia submarina]